MSHLVAANKSGVLFQNKIKVLCTMQARTSNWISPYVVLVKNAIEYNKDPKGTSRKTINKFIDDNYSISGSADSVNTKITQGIKDALEENIISQVSGSGTLVRGRFRIADKDAAPKAAKKAEKKNGRPKKTDSTDKKKATKTGRPKKTAEAAAGEKKKVVKKAGRPKKDSTAATKIPKVVDLAKKKAGRRSKTPNSHGC